MDIKNYPRLCVGTFFTLLLQAAKQGLNERDGFGKNTEFAEGDVFGALIQVAVPTYKKPADSDNFGSTVSKYKSCLLNGRRLPIYEQAYRTTFDRRIKSEYHIPLEAMAELNRKYVDIEGKADWLLRALLELISKDESICAADSMFVCEDGSSITKREICTLADICLPSFLLGVWHYIIMNRPDNSIGKETYEDWCRPGKSNNTREPFESNIGESIKQRISLTLPKKLISEGEANQDENVEEDGEDEEEPAIDYDKPHEAEPDPMPNMVNQFINSPVMFFNSGANAKIINNNTGTININRGGAA